EDHSYGPAPIFEMTEADVKHTESGDRQDGSAARMYAGQTDTFRSLHGLKKTQ
ncbi:hypothetical protein STEG23_005839, partial [Scotinomys teguina]